MGSGASAWAKVAEATKAGEKYHRQGIGRSDETMVDEVRAIVETSLAKEPPAELEVTREGARLALLGPAVHFQLPTLFAPLVRFWCEARGVDFALAATLSSLQFERHTPDDYANYGAWLTRRTKPSIDGWTTYPIWPLLHRAYLDASEAERGRARDVARAARVGAGLALRAAVAFAVPDDDALWTEDDRRAVVQSTDVHSELPHFAVLAECRRTKLTFGDDHPSAGEIGSALGKDAFVALQILYRYPTPDVGDALAALATPAALSALADPADRKDIGATIDAGLRAAPQAAIEGLAPRTLRGGRPLHPFAHAILLSIVAEHPALARASAAPEEAVAALLAESGAEQPEAEPRELPRALSHPPWRDAPKKGAAKDSKKKPTTDEPLASVAFDERIDWRGSPPDLRDNWHGWGEKELVARIEENRRGDETMFLHDFAWADVLKPATVVRLLGEIPTTKLYGQVDDIERILFTHGLDVLEPLLAYVKRQPDRIEALRGVDSPRVAALAAHAFATSNKNKEAAQRWLDEHPRAAAVGLLPDLVRTTGKARLPAETALRHLSRAERSLLDDVARAYGPAAESALGTLLGAPSGPAIPKKLPKLPPYLRADRLPRPLLADRSKALSRDAIEVLLAWLAISKREEPQSALAEIARALDPRSLARFAFGVFVAWVMAKGPAKDAWAMDALAAFGDAEVARALVPLARTWAPGGLPQRAQTLVSVLAAMGNDAALLGIHRLTKVQSRALAAHAEKTLAKVAASRGLSKEDLADRLVPDLGLDADGTKRFDVGGRSFFLRFDEELVPTLVDGDGNALDDLPKPRKGDDAESAAFAIAEWKELKKSAKRLAKEQTARFETAMSTGRRFSKEHFETFFARHPFVVHIARRLLWGSYGDSVVPFRIAEDGGLVGADEREIALAPDCRIGLVHPLDLDVEARKVWGDRFSDYELIQPFAQLGRDTYEVLPAERSSAALARFDGKKVASGKLLGLDRIGWKRESARQGGVVSVFERSFGDVLARFEVEPGVYLGDPTMHPEQTLRSVFFGRRDLMPLDAVPKVVFTEVVRDLTLLVG